MNYHNITKCDMLNGEGLRVVLWLSHCIHDCPGCHNPQTHAAESGIPFDDDALAELFAELGRDYCSGITFSGGDPLSPLNRKPVMALAGRIRREFPTKNIWLYTGFTWEEIASLDGMEAVDVVVDGPYLIARNDSTLPYRGSTNQRLIDVRRSLETGEAVEWRINQ